MIDYSWKRTLLLISIILISVATLLFLLFNRSNIFGLSEKLSSFNKPEPGSCLVLEEKYCHGGYSIIKDASVGFKIPAGTLLFAPFDGWKIVSTATFLKSGGSYARVKVFVSPDGDLEKGSLFVTFTPGVNIPTAAAVKKGDVVGKVSSTTVSEAGDYNLVVGAAVRSITAPEIKSFIEPFYESLLRR